LSGDHDLESLSDEPVLAIGALLNRAILRYEKTPKELLTDDFDYFLESFTIVTFYLEKIDDLKIQALNLKSSKLQIINQIIGLFKPILSEVNRRVQEYEIELKFSDLRKKYSAKFGKSFFYEFTDGDLVRVQNLINELRDIISASDLIESDHKLRILKRLEKIQSELHKKMSDVDRLWGLIGDAGVLIGKFGKNAKPMVDRIREISNIVWRTQSRAEELPSDAPMEMINQDENEV